MLVNQPKGQAIFTNIWQVNFKTMKSQFGELIRTHGKKQHLHLRQVALLLEMDTAQMSIIEKRMLQLKREQTATLTEILRASNDDLITLCLANQIYEVLKDEMMLNEAM